MKLKAAIWAVAILICGGFGFRQRENLSIVWREYSSLWRDCEYREHYPEPRKPLVRGSVARTDPEAAAVAGIALSRDGKDAGTISLAENLLLFPSNEFFLCQLAMYLSDDSAIDPQIRLAVATKLTNQRPAAANYHYLKADALLACRQDNNIGPVLAEIERGNQCADYDWPYQRYRQRAVAIAEKAKLSRLLLRDLSTSDYRSYCPSDLERSLLALAAVAFTDGNNSAGFFIDDVLNRMSDRRIAAGDRTAITLRNLGGFGSYSFGHWNCPQGLELQRAALSSDRARQNRLELGASVARILDVREKKQPYSGQSDSYDQPDDLMDFALLVCAHSGKMFAAAAMAILILLAASCVQGFGEKSKIGLGAIVLFALAAIAFFFVANALFIGSLVDECTCCSFFYSDVLRPPLIGLELIREEPLMVSIFLFGPLATILILWAVSFFKRGTTPFWKYWYIQTPLSLVVAIICTLALAVIAYANEEILPWVACLLVFAITLFASAALAFFGWWFFKCRPVRLFLLAIFLGPLAFITTGSRYFGYVPMVLFVLASAVIAANKPSQGVSFWKGLLWFFGRQPAGAMLRNKCTRLIGPFVVVYLLLFLSLIPLFARCIDTATRPYDLPYPVVSMPPADDAAYQRVLAALNEESGNWDAYRLIGLVMPEDLPTVLEKVKKPRVPSSKEETLLQMLYGPARGRNGSFRPATGRNDGLLLAAIQCVGKDAVNIVADAMDNPERERVLVARSKLGDHRVKGKLEELLKLRMPVLNEPKDTSQYSPYWEVPATSAEIIAALACVSEPNEAAQRYLDYIQKREVSALIEDGEFFRSINLLPTKQAQTVIKTYLAQAEGWKSAEWKNSDGEFYRVTPDRILSPLHRLLGVYGDTEIAEKVFEIMLRAAESDIHFDLCNVSPYFTAESSQLLLKGLGSRNEDMRAWCVWQLRKMAYRFTDDELNKLLSDPSWKVRANTAAAEPERTKKIAARDKNAFVWLVATLCTGSF